MQFILAGVRIRPKTNGTKVPLEQAGWRTAVFFGGSDLPKGLAGADGLPQSACRTAYRRGDSSRQGLADTESFRGSADAKRRPSASARD
jgi:hypothetical protein